MKHVNMPVFGHWVCGTKGSSCHDVPGVDACFRMSTKALTTGESWRVLGNTTLTSLESIVQS